MARSLTHSLSPQSLLSPVAFGFGCESLALLEEQGDGAQWHNLSRAPAEDVFSLAQVSAFLLLDAAIYGFALWYLEAVYPGGERACSLEARDFASCCLVSGLVLPRMGGAFCCSLFLSRPQDLTF